MPVTASADKTEDAKPTCFIAMPVTTHPKQAESYGDPDHWKHVMDVLFIPAIEAAGYAAVTPIAEGGDMIHARIIAQLERAEMVLCDLTSLNANVMFEFGIRTALDRPTAVVAEKDGDFRLPFDTNVINTHFYASDLKPWDLPREIEALTSYITSTKEASDGGNRFWHYFGLTLRAKEPVVTESPEEAALDLRIADIGHRMMSMERMIYEVLQRQELGVNRQRAQGVPALREVLDRFDLTAENPIEFADDESGARLTLENPEAAVAFASIEVKQMMDFLSQEDMAGRVAMRPNGSLRLTLSKRLGSRSIPRLQHVTRSLDVPIEIAYYTDPSDGPTRVLQKM